jgi:hypothetical protein
MEQGEELNVSGTASVPADPPVASVPTASVPALEPNAAAAPATETTTASAATTQLSSGAVTTAVAPSAAPTSSGFRIEVIAHGVRIIHDPSAPTNENNTTKYDDVSHFSDPQLPY